MSAEHLYIIGNGFDRYHGAKSSYWDFRGYLLRHDEWSAKFFITGPAELYNVRHFAGPGHYKNR